MNSIRESLVLSLCLSLIFAPSIVWAAPQGGKVVGGSASIQQSGANTTINQSSDRAVINWHSFDIAKHEAVRHNMPSSSSAALHRVVGGGGASQIEGLLQSNGNIYLVNPAGVVIHKGARIDTNGFVATSRDISNSNFMNGKMVFDKPGLAGAQVINQGEITVRESGLAALVAPSVRNEGLIAAKLGKVALASADAAWSLDMHGDDLITFTLDEKAVNSLHGADGKPLASVANNGSIKAEGGVVVLTAAQLDGIVGSVVNSGEVSAASAEIAGGMITFKGQGSGVDISNTGMLDVSSAVADAGSVRMDTDGKVSSSGSITATGGKKGGKVTLTGRDIALKDGAKIDASGNSGGGTVLVGGNALGKGPERNARTTNVEKRAVIHADAKVKGDGGQVVVWSDETTTFDGTVTAKGGSEGGNGGQVETSGKSLKIGDTARVSTLAPKGLFGEWLLDPVDFVIAESGGNVTGDVISTLLAENNMVFTSDGGSVYVNDDIIWTSAATLTLNAYKNIDINKTITATHDNAGLWLNAKNGDINFRAKITLSGENPTLVMDGKKYTVINTIEQLQDINKSAIDKSTDEWKLNGYYALGSDIDATDTKNWNDGKGFCPLGGYFDRIVSGRGVYFAGVFNGLGHVINNLTINRPTEDHVGLFGITRSGARISNLGLNNVSFVGYSQAGGLVGCAYTAEIKNCYVTGNLTAHRYSGGFVGRVYGGNSNDSAWTNSIVNCFADVDITKLYSDSEYLGSFTALVDGTSAPRIVNSYSVGRVPSRTNEAGFCVDKGIAVRGFENCFFDKYAANSNYSVGGALARTTSQMMQASNYTGWDFTNTWTIDEGKSYPKLKIFTTVAPEIPVPPAGDASGIGGGSIGATSSTNRDKFNIISNKIYADAYDTIYLDKNNNINMIRSYPDINSDNLLNTNTILSEDAVINIHNALGGFIIEHTGPALISLNDSFSDINTTYLHAERFKNGVATFLGSAIELITSDPFSGAIGAAKIIIDNTLDYSTNAGIFSAVMANTYFEKSKQAYNEFITLYNSQQNYSIENTIKMLEIYKLSIAYSIGAQYLSGEACDSIDKDLQIKEKYGFIGSVIYNASSIAVDAFAFDDLGDLSVSGAILASLYNVVSKWDDTIEFGENFFGWTDIVLFPQEVQDKIDERLAPINKMIKKLELAL